MYDAPDPDWYFENVLAYAEPGPPRALGGPAAEWQAWWRQRWRDAAATTPADTTPSLRDDAQRPRPRRLPWSVRIR